MPYEDILRRGIKVGEQFVDDPVVVTHQKTMSKTDFKGLFTEIEYRAISNRTATDDKVFQFWDMAQTADFIDMSDARITTALTYISSLGDITAERLAELLLGKPV